MADFLQLLAEPFVISAFVIIVLMSIPAGAIGCLLLWQRMVFFADCIAHSSLLGVAMAFLLQLQQGIGLLLCCILVPLLYRFLLRQDRVPSDTALNIIAYCSLSLGIIITQLRPEINFDLHQLMFGALLLTAENDLWLFASSIMLLGGFFYWQWPKLLIASLQSNLAIAEGINVEALKLAFTLCVSFLIAVTVHIFGILLITSLLIIPAATAKQFAKTPLQMAIIASSICAIGGSVGLVFGLLLDVTITPVMICSLGVILAISIMCKKR